jgi:hypothetical protein
MPRPRSFVLASSIARRPIEYSLMHRRLNIRLELYAFDIPKLVFLFYPPRARTFHLYVECYGSAQIDARALTFFFFHFCFFLCFFSFFSPVLCNWRNEIWLSTIVMRDWFPPSRTC